MWLIMIHFGFMVRFRSIHDDQLLLYQRQPHTKSCTISKWEWHCLITWYFYYWWSSHCTSKRQTYLYLIFSFQFCFLFSFVIFLLFIYFFLWTRTQIRKDKNVSEVCLFQVGLRRCGGDDSLKWDLGVGYTSTRKENRVQMSLHCRVKPRWISGSLKGEIGCQRILTGVWTGLCGYLLPGCEITSGFLCH